jgi:septal ring factor EnvC (AmiA/AmiB activator)
MTSRLTRRHRPRPDNGRGRGVAPVLLAVLATQFAAPAARAEDPPPSAREELESARKAVEVGREKQIDIRREIEALDRDRVRIGERLVESAARARALETALTQGEGRIAGLARRTDELRASLAARRGVLAEVLAALQRIGRKPPPAIVVRPEDARAAVRSAILVGALLPELRAEAERLVADLDALDKIRSDAVAERDRQKAEATALAEEQVRLRLLVEERRKARDEREKTLIEAQRTTEETARRASGLEELIGRLEAAQPSSESATKPAALPDVARLQPTLAFAEARGRLSPPVGGDLVRRFGEDDGLGGGPARGLTYAARTGAVVTSPCEGRIVFLGPFRSYGRLLIINGGGGYHVVLAGLARIDVEAGQFVLAGEPVGVMGGPTVPGLIGTGTDRPSLYVEFRKDNTSIDPMPWWAGPRDEKVRG